MSFSHMFDDRSVIPPVVSSTQELALTAVVLQVIAEAALGGSTIGFPGLGQFRTVTTAERRDYNPSTGAPIITPAAKTVVFEPAAPDARTAKLKVQSIAPRR